MAGEDMARRKEPKKRLTFQERKAKRAKRSALREPEIPQDVKIKAEVWIAMMQQKHLKSEGRMLPPKFIFDGLRQFVSADYYGQWINWRVRQYRKKFKEWLSTKQGQRYKAFLDWLTFIEAKEELGIRVAYEFPEWVKSDEGRKWLAERGLA